MENWKIIDGASGRRPYTHGYEVSDCGNIRRMSDGHVMQGDLSKGYRRIQLPGIGRKMIHRLVVEAFIGPITEGLECNHKNGIKTDNRAENLEIVTRRENNLHKFRVLKHRTQAGTAHGMAKLRDTDVIEIRRLRSEGMMLKDIAAKFNMGVPMISLIANRINWTHI